MFLKKHATLLMILSTCFTLLVAEEAVVQEQPRVVEIISCKKIALGLTIDQTTASKEEREEALKIATDFFQVQIAALSDELAEKAKNIFITLYLTGVEEDDAAVVTADGE